MTAHARRYFERSPRYVLHPLDSSMMRFKNGELDGQAVSATVVNVSETGLSFTMGGDEFPEVDELLMIEFTIPGQKQIACYANVVRIEAQTGWHPEHGETALVRVALSFHKMPSPYRRALQTSLKQRVAAEEDFDTAGESSMIERGINLALATAGLLMLFQTLQVPPQKLFQLFSQFMG